MHSLLRILHLEDDAKDAELLQAILEAEGIVSHITRVDSQADFLAALAQRDFDVIFADYTLPSFDGLSALKIALETCPDVPFIFVSGTLGEELAIEALKIGATDYVLKERLSRLVPSVQRALREAQVRTERKRAEEALRQTQAELAHVARLTTLGELTASIAHEINQPLGAMVNSANACVRWLAAQNLERAQQSAVRIVADGQRAGAIITRIRALAKNAPFRKDWLDLNDTIRDVLALAHSEVQRHRVMLKTHLAEPVPLVRADRIQLQQVLLNLIINAIEAMSGVDDGPREVEVQSAPDAAPGVRVTVRDSGPGLDPQRLDRLFDAFYTTKPHGLGLGLAISRRLIEAHGGRLWATANAPHGAVFQFTVPRGSEEGA